VVLMLMRVVLMLMRVVLMLMRVVLVVPVCAQTKRAWCAG